MVALLHATTALLFANTAVLNQESSSLESQWAEACAINTQNHFDNIANFIIKLNNLGWQTLTEDISSSDPSYKAVIESIKEVSLPTLTQIENSDINAFRDQQLFRAGYATGFADTQKVDLVAKTLVFSNNGIKPAKIIAVTILNSKALNANDFIKSCVVFELNKSEQVQNDTNNFLKAVYGANNPNGSSRTSTWYQIATSKRPQGTIAHTVYDYHNSKLNHSISINYSLQDYIAKK
jgi:hypothetical protein